MILFDEKILKLNNKELITFIKFLKSLKYPRVHQIHVKERLEQNIIEYEIKTIKQKIRIRIKTDWIAVPYEIIGNVENIILISPSTTNDSSPSILFKHYTNNKNIYTLPKMKKIYNILDIITIEDVSIYME